MIELHDHEARHIAVLYRQLRKHLDRELAPHGLGHGRHAYLFALMIEDGRTQQALADAAVTDKAAAARTLKCLEADGYVSRRPDPHDRRMVRVFLTARGRRQRALMERAAAATVDALTVALSVEERELFRSLLAAAARPLLPKPPGPRDARAPARHR
jgi:DNA-binding MarR family transcriptional regulator